MTGRDAAALFHVAEAEHWAAARSTGRYERSTRGLGLGEVGFVHLSTADQWRGVLERFYADHDGGLVLLEIDPARLDAPLRWEVADPATAEEFPHLYGPLPVAAVTSATPLSATGVEHWTTQAAAWAEDPGSPVGDPWDTRPLFLRIRGRVIDP